MIEMSIYIVISYFRQAEDGILDVDGSRGFGDVYKRQIITNGLFSGDAGVIFYVP